MNNFDKDDRNQTKDKTITRSVLDCVHVFCVCTIGRHLLRRFPRNHGCQGPFILPIPFGWSLWYVHRRERHARYIGLFVDY